MTRRWMVIMAMAGLFFTACKNDKQDEATQVTPVQQDTTVNATTPPPPANEMGALEAESWRLTKFVETGTVLPLSDSLFITVDFDGTIVSGIGGCNQYRANYTKGEGNSLQIDSLSTSKRLCKGLMGMEKRYLSILGKAGAYNMPDSLTLEIKSANGLLTFRAAENGVVKYLQGRKQ
ncbi:MAG: META domain-containing protein [Saprospiraceae bacterium]|nr:META domain-containing protein [Saprospiraceae bacterium]